MARRGNACNASLSVYRTRALRTSVAKTRNRRKRTNPTAGRPRVLALHLDRILLGAPSDEITNRVFVYNRGAADSNNNVVHTVSRLNFRGRAGRVGILHPCVPRDDAKTSRVRETEHRWLGASDRRRRSRSWRAVLSECAARGTALAFRRRRVACAEHLRATRCVLIDNDAHRHRLERLKRRATTDGTGRDGGERVSRRVVALRDRWTVKRVRTRTGAEDRRVVR